VAASHVSAVKTPIEAMARMRSRASMLRTAFAVLLIVGIIGSVLVGFEAGKSVNFDTGLLLTSSSTNNTARGVTVFLVVLFATVITTLPLLGISWVIDGQADLLEGRPEEH
jgi:hypothetical protein